MKASDWEQVANIYLEGIKTGIATFQTEVPTFESWSKYITGSKYLTYNIFFAIKIINMLSSLENNSTEFKDKIVGNTIKITYKRNINTNNQ